MKKIQFIPLFALLITCFCFAQCKKNNNTNTSDNPYGLPNATQTGIGVFACRINGVNAIAQDDINHQGAGIVNDTFAVKGDFLIGGFFTTIYLGLEKNPMKNVTYNLSDTLHTYCFFVTDSTCMSIGNVTAISSRIGTITFSKIDTINKIFSGTFSFKVPITGCDTANITDGRFDCHY